jgi:hypothetical protein
MFERARKSRALFRIVPQPVQQLRESPFRRIHSTAPLNGLELLAVRTFGNFLRFLLGAVIAPQVVVIQRFHF